MFVAKRLEKDSKENSNSELTYIWWSNIISIFTYVLNFLVFTFYKHTTCLEYTIVFMITVGVVDTYANSLWFVSYETFNARIANKEIPGTFMNVMNAISNLANEWHKPIIFYLMDYINYWYLVIGGLIYSIGFLTFTRKWLITKEKLDDEWKFKVEKPTNAEIEL